MKKASEKFIGFFIKPSEENTVAWLCQASETVTGFCVVFLYDASRPLGRPRQSTRLYEVKSSVLDFTICCKG